MTNRMDQVLMVVVGLMTGTCVWSGPGPTTTFAAHNTVTAEEAALGRTVRTSRDSTTQHAQWRRQDLQDWRQRRDVIDAQIAGIEARLQDPALTEVERKVLVDRKWALEQDRKSVDEWIKRTFEYLIHVP